jgi:phenylacetate-coenzyme A ligase PaaK-like adenylate-forming protein
VAAEQAGFDLAGSTFRVGGEPVTPVKAERIERSGARVMPTYGAIETGPIGVACARPAEIDEVHLTRDLFAVITHPLAVDSGGRTVPALNLTSLVASSSKVMLNYQIDDYGVVHERACGCPLQEAGYSSLLYGIRSYTKLLGEGVTLMGADLIRIVEEVLPARFGGSSLDYQMTEAEDAGGLTRLHVRVHPRLPNIDPDDVVNVVLTAIRDSSSRGDSGGSVWQQASTLRVVREDPVATNRGKLQPLQSHRAAHHAERIRL